MRGAIHREYVTVLHFHNVPQCNAQTNIVDYLSSITNTAMKVQALKFTEIIHFIT